MCKQEQESHSSYKEKHDYICVKDMMQNTLQYPLFISLEAVME